MSWSNPWSRLADPDPIPQRIRIRPKNQPYICLSQNLMTKLLDIHTFKIIFDFGGIFVPDPTQLRKRMCIRPKLLDPDPQLWSNPYIIAKSAQCHPYLKNIQQYSIFFETMRDDVKKTLNFGNVSSFGFDIKRANKFRKFHLCFSRILRTQIFFNFLAMLCDRKVIWFNCWLEIIYGNKF